MSTNAVCSSQPAHDCPRIAYRRGLARATRPAIPYPRARCPVLGSEGARGVSREVGPQDGSGNGEVGDILIPSSDPAILPAAAMNLERPECAASIPEDGAGAPASLYEVNGAGELREVGCARGGAKQEDEE